MNRLSHLTVTTLLAALLSLLSTSCEDSFIFDYEGDCSVRYHIQFSYDMNMKFANAFAHEVTSVSLYVFDESGKLAYQAHEQGDTLATPGYGMTLEMNEGTYDLLAWCGVGNGESFAIPEAIVGVTTIEEMKCRMHRTHTNGQAYVDEDLRPLFHGQKRITIENTPGTHYETMYLTAPNLEINITQSLDVRKFLGYITHFQNVVIRHFVFLSSLLHIDNARGGPMGRNVLVLRMRKYQTIK